MTFNPPSFLPPVLATGVAQSSNGRQQLGNGLVTHKGILDVNCVRATGILYPQSGRGLELVFNQSGPYGLVQAYDRDTGQYCDLYLTGKNINLQTSGGKVTLPAGTAQALVGQYHQALTWNPPQINVWTESPVQANCTFTGFGARIEWSTVIASPTKGAVCYVGIGLNGAVTYSSESVFHVPEVNYIVPVSGVLYTGALSGAQRVSLWLYVNALGTGINPGANSMVWVSEQRA